MRRLLMMIVVVALVATPLLAVEPGRAEGALTIDNNRIPLLYAYAIHKQKNQLTNKDEDTKIILTDKPLPENAQLSDIDYNFPEGIFGVVVCVDKRGYVSH